MGFQKPLYRYTVATQGVLLINLHNNNSNDNRNDFQLMMS